MFMLPKLLLFFILAILQSTEEQPAKSSGTAFVAQPQP